MANHAHNIVSPLDAEYAVSIIQESINARGMSTTDLAVELGWKRKQVEEVLYGTDSPTRSSLEAIASVLDIELDWEEE